MIKYYLLESYGGTVAQMETYLSQLQQLGAFEKVAGILLGTFTQMEAEKCSPDIETLVRRKAGKELPIAVTKKIGHGTDAKAIVNLRTKGKSIMKYRSVGKSGLKVSEIALGSWMTDLAGSV